MKRISSQTTFLYQIVWPLFSTFCLLILVKLCFTYPAMIAIVLIFIIIGLSVIPMFIKLKDVWVDNDNLIITGIQGGRVILHKSDILEITQNPSMVTPRLVRIKYKLFDSNPQFIRFIPKGGYWIFWEHGIVNELRDWMNEKASTQQRV